MLLQVLPPFHTGFIQTNNTEDAAKGFILIKGGEFEIISAHDAIQADIALTVADGNFNITSGGGVSKTQLVTFSDTTSDSFKGLKAAGDILIAKGTFVIDSYDDSIDLYQWIFIITLFPIALSYIAKKKEKETKRPCDFIQ